MRYDPQKHHRRSIRLKEYDYSQPSAYFVTIVVKDRDCPFGDVIDGEMKLSRAGEIVDEFWKQIPNHFQNAVLEEFVVMPNHLHAIVFITENVGAGSPRPYKPTLGQIIGYFKYQSTKRINELRDTTGAPLWQRNYYEHIIRNEKELDRIRKYVIENPAHWSYDDENPMMQRQAAIP